MELFKFEQPIPLTGLLIAWLKPLFNSYVCIHRKNKDIGKIKSYNKTAIMANFTKVHATNIMTKYFSIKPDSLTIEWNIALKLCLNMAI